MHCIEGLAQGEEWRMVAVGKEVRKELEEGGQTPYPAGQEEGKERR